ncbi:substrate-binding periplasmic protein [Pseudogemmobacter sonorensis]|uniref:substrate-binding periplasmic protein n=1 Tax=Pseudogemmobacter sonorensis TaxID=2989681 RepID=UPI0036853D42
MTCLKNTLAGTLFCFAVSTFSAAAQTCPSDLETVENGSLTVAVTTFAPYSFMDANNELSGIDGDIVKAIAEKLCLTVKPLVVDPAAAIQSVMAKRADLTIGDWYRTAERAKVMAFSDPIYLDSMGIYSSTGTSSVEDLVGHTVGTVQGYLWVPALQTLLGSDLKLYPSSVNLQQDLMAGRIDFAVDGAATGQLAMSKGELGDITVAIAEPDPRVPASIEPAQVGFPMSKEAVRLVAATNEVLAEMKGEGIIVEILSQYGLDPAIADVGEPRFVE